MMRFDYIVIHSDHDDEWETKMDQAGAQGYRMVQTIPTGETFVVVMERTREVR